jgi:hypothetical protein
MESLLTITILVVLFLCVLFLRRGDVVTPHTRIKAVRAGGKAWTAYSGCLRDAQLEGWKWAVLKNNEIIEVKTGKRTGRKFVQRNKKTP